jgi:hypothetical protein
LPFILGACAAAPPPRPSITCTDVESKLVGLDRASGAAGVRAAQRLGLTVQGDRVQLALVLATEDPGLLDRLGLEGSGRGTRYQAFVPFDRICELGSLPEIVAVRAPAPAFEQ